MDAAEQVPVQLDGSPNAPRWNSGDLHGYTGRCLKQRDLVCQPGGESERNNGAYRSTNSGSTWIKSNASGSLTLPNGPLEVLALTPHPTTASQDVLYALVNAPSHPAPARCPTKSGG